MKVDLKQRIAGLTERYIASLPEKYTRIEQAWEKFEQQQGEENYRNLHKEIHDLAGSAGLYNCNDLHLASRKVIKLLRGGSEMSEINVAMEALLTQLDNDAKAS